MVQTHDKTLKLITSTTDFLDNVATYKYDEKNRLSEMRFPDKTPDNPDDNPIIVRKYDEGVHAVWRSRIAP